MCNFLKLMSYIYVLHHQERKKVNLQLATMFDISFIETEVKKWGSILLTYFMRAQVCVDSKNQATFHVEGQRIHTNAQCGGVGEKKKKKYFMFNILLPFMCLPAWL